MADDERSRDLAELYVRFGDDRLVLGHRLSEWCGHAPVLEEELALGNLALDLLDQATVLLERAGSLEGRGRSADELALFRDASAFRNLLLVEQPNGNYADTIARQFLFDQWHVLLLGQLTLSRDERVAGIAAKAVKEVRYHVERSSGWVIRLGDGTDVSHARMQSAIENLWMYTGEMFAADDTERFLIDAGIAADTRALEPHWQSSVNTVLEEATLAPPADRWMQGAKGRGGKQGVHTEHLSHLLADMQTLPRSYPDARW